MASEKETSIKVTAAPEVSGATSRLIKSAPAAPTELAPARVEISPRELSSPQLLAETTREALNLIKSEIELAKIELRADLKSEVAAAKGLSVAAVCALSMLNLLLVAAALGLAAVMPAWAAALVVAGVVALAGAIAGVVGWKHVKPPLAQTRKSLEEDLRWVKERTA